MKAWLGRSGQNYGPYSADEFQRMLQQGAVTASDWVWREGDNRWISLGEFIYGSGRVPLQPPQGGWPTPNSMEWGIVLALGIITCGLFNWIWLLVQAKFVKSLDRSNDAILLLVSGFLVVIGYHFVLGYMAVTRSINQDFLALLNLVGLGVYLLNFILFLVAVFGMRRVLVQHYNSVENIGLRLSGVMTFFFAPFYFQHHLTRIARWKRSGVLVPQ